jgi:UDP-glucose 4-epimerase
MKVLITGGSGFIGSHIVKKCLDMNYTIVVVDRQSPNEHIDKSVKYYKMDIRDEQMHIIFKVEQPDIVIHHAAQVVVSDSVQNPLNDADINILGTINILHCCGLYGVKKILFASSAAVYGMPNVLPISENHPIRPISVYGASKYSAEVYIQTFSNFYNFDYVILRYSNVYGNRQNNRGEGGLISILIDRIMKQESIYIYGDGSQTRDFIHVDDVVEANIKAMLINKNMILNIGTGISTSVNLLLEILKDIQPFDLRTNFVERKHGDIMHSALDNTAALNILDWKPKQNVSSGLTTLYKDSVKVSDY